jgi:hypothetical protein
VTIAAAGIVNWKVEFGSASVEAALMVFFDD